MTVNQVALGVALAVVGALATIPFGTKPANAACALGPSNAPNGNGMDVYCSPDPAPAPTIQQGPVIPKCMTEQNAMRPCSQDQQHAAAVDPHIVGTWYLKEGQGFWVLEVLGNGTFKFHSEANDGVLPSAGSFSADNGHWSLNRSDGYTDGGIYSFQSHDSWISHDIWIAVGKLGIGAWVRHT